MCRIVECFDCDKSEHAALDMLAQLRAETDDVKRHIFTVALYRLDARIIDWIPLTIAMTGADKSEHIRRNRIFATEEGLLKALRQWSHKTRSDALDHSEGTRAIYIAGMLSQVISKSQHTSRMNGYNIGARYVINDYGLAYLSWLDAREQDRNACADVLARDAWQDTQDARYVGAGW